MENRHNTQLTEKNKLDRIEHQDDRILRLLREERTRVQKRFPLPFALAATVGAAATLSGINKMIDEVDFLVNNPIILVIVGLLILIVTGAAYKKLG